ncbi:shTK domain protein [Teladorsagia circumcincta]|uniref:ShTK domain protein n=1 Tax=Teladorsagia circumcincta TaxID=45464 RepID=A0A2G9UP46_TELCI|nr:shTK domain protein [Teladorsagia circumcincta]
MCEDGYHADVCPSVKDWCTSTNPEHASFVRSNCQKTCGFCCEDGYHADVCPSVKDWCNSTNPEHASFVRSNCRKTCGFCTV